MNSYSDLARDIDANQEAYNFWREKTRHRVKDPKTAKLLVPDDPPHPFGAKRLALENGYFELYNEPNIHLVDVKTNPIARFEPEGIRLEDGTLHELDVVVVATGFDGLTGGLKDIAIRGRGGELLSEKWAKGTWTYLGLASAGFPNLFFTYGPQAPTVYANGPSITEPQGEYLAELLNYLRSHKIKRIEAEKEAEQNWRVLVNELSKRGLRHYTPSWYNGANIPGKPVEALNYAGGLPTYLKTIAEVRDQGYKGFKLSGA
jgi:cation diffusion facilitator CzcD-associated flavoprotein CzcO